MVFTDYSFLLAFLPIALCLTAFVRQKTSPQSAISLLVFISLIFYSWGNPYLVQLIVFSILVNYCFHVLQFKASEKATKKILIFMIVFNLTLLIYFKYYNFFVLNINGLIKYNLSYRAIALPLAISFYTFQQIAFGVDAFKGLVKSINLRSYFLFVCFFPQLIAGPIVHHIEMTPQFTKDRFGRLFKSDIIIGLAIITLGIIKKVVIADNLGRYVAPLYALADGGTALSSAEAWFAMLGYSGQIYFDFAGYSDIAIGLARLFGITLPMNFNSPYKSANIIDFWRRWHITLSRFLKDYLYIALGGNRKGKARRHINLMITMLLGGLWHGASWNFVLWGGLHGLYLMINHGWRKLQSTGKYPALPKALSHLLTFIFVCLAWVYFRAATLKGGSRVIKSLVNFDSEPLLNEILSINSAMLLLAAFAIAFFAPNTQQILRAYKPVLEDIPEYRFIGKKLNFSINNYWLFALGILFGLVMFYEAPYTEFIYWKF